MKKVKFIYNPNSGDKRIKNEIDTIIQIYQAYDYCVVPYRLTKLVQMRMLFWDIEDNYDHILLSGGDGTIDLLINIIKARNRHSYSNITFRDCKRLCKCYKLPTRC